MVSSKTKVLALVFNIIIFVGIVAFCCFGNLTFPAHLGAFIFSIPLVFSTIYSIILLKSNSENKCEKLTKIQKFLIVGMVISAVVFLFYVAICIIGLRQNVESINGTIEGYIVSETQTKEELLQYMYSRLYSNIYVAVLNLLMFATNIFNFTLLYKQENLKRFPRHQHHLP